MFLYLQEWHDSGQVISLILLPRQILLSQNQTIPRSKEDVKAYLWLESTINFPSANQELISWRPFFMTDGLFIKYEPQYMPCNVRFFTRAILAATWNSQRSFRFLNCLAKHIFTRQFYLQPDVGFDQSSTSQSDAQEVKKIWGERSRKRPEKRLPLYPSNGSAIDFDSVADANWCFAENWDNTWIVWVVVLVWHPCDGGHFMNFLRDPRTVMIKANSSVIWNLPCIGDVEFKYWISSWDAATIWKLATRQNSTIEYKRPLRSWMLKTYFRGWKEFLQSLCEHVWGESVDLWDSAASKANDEDLGTPFHTLQAFLKLLATHIVKNGIHTLGYSCL